MDPVHLITDLEDLKVIFRVLSAHLTDHPGLLDTELFVDIRTRLERAARFDGVNAADHVAFGRWLGAELALDGRAGESKRPSLN